MSTQVLLTEVSRRGKVVVAQAQVSVSSWSIQPGVIGSIHSQPTAASFPIQVTTVSVPGLVMTGATPIQVTGSLSQLNAGYLADGYLVGEGCLDETGSLTFTLVGYALPRSTHCWVEQILDGRRIFHLDPPVVAEVSQEAGCWTVSYEDLGIVAADTSEDAAWAAFHMEFASIWDHIGQEKNKHLTIDARRLKRAIRKRVANIELTS